MNKYLVYKNRNIFTFVSEEAPEGDVVRQLSEAESSLELRYAVENGEFVDKFTGKTDDEVLAAIAAGASQASVTFVDKVSPVEFKLLFTPQERIAIKTVRATDAVIDDFYDIAEDPRLTHVDLSLQTTKMAIAYMVSLNLLTAERAEQILAGQAPE